MKRTRFLTIYPFDDYQATIYKSWWQEDNLGFGGGEGAQDLIGYIHKNTVYKYDQDHEVVELKFPIEKFNSWEEAFEFAKQHFKVEEVHSSEPSEFFFYTGWLKISKQVKV